MYRLSSVARLILNLIILWVLNYILSAMVKKWTVQYCSDRNSSELLQQMVHHMWYPSWVLPLPLITEHTLFAMSSCTLLSSSCVSCLFFLLTHDLSMTLKPIHTGKFCAFFQARQFTIILPLFSVISQPGLPEMML